MTQAGELLMDMRICWDSKSLREIDEAKAKIMAFFRKGHEILLSDGQRFEKFRPYYEEVLIRAKRINKQVIKILSENGDDRIVWDKDDGREAKEAKAKFQELLKKGYKAYSVDASGNKGRKIEEFDVDAEEILMVSETVKG